MKLTCEPTPALVKEKRPGRPRAAAEDDELMMTEVADHSKRNHTESYFSGKAVTSSSEEFGAMTSKKQGIQAKEGLPYTQRLLEKKDKIGERVAALQQLVSPFGKTDTASVLQEASGYIRFLHQQLEVLRSPYIRAPPLAGAAPEDHDHYSLRNRGLCLVPVDLTLQLTQSNGADLWAPANATRRK
ncbi:hypothetical protein GUJ93_ZPchr0004g38971 [Zizania palustris]|uniref:BHLH domain-containing protein n=1 Tax=Zizania palustris TaxID=103762 RepID=A0A8J5S162_ZIZPA|nr:hypothetical protein GUJ93_ZPchr0004g38971 [Zizania palustris]